MEESEAPAFVACPYCRLELPRELIRSHVEDQHVASTLSSKKEDEEKEKSGSKKGGTIAGPSSTYNPNNNSRVDQTRAQENKNKNAEQAARKEKKKSSQDPFEESLNFPQWSDSEDDPDPVEEDDEVSKRGGEGSKKTDPSTEEGRNSLEEAKLEMAKSKKLMEEVKSNKDKLDKLRQSQGRSAQESKNQNETRVAAPKTVMERLKEVERMTQLEKRSQAQKNQLQPKVLRNLEINGKSATSHLKNQSPTQTRSQSQIKSAAPQPLEPQVALCGLCSFPNPFRTTQTLLAHVKRAHEKAAANNLAEIRHRVAPAKNYPATVGKNQGADDNQPVVDEEVVRDDTLMPQIIRVTVLLGSH